jgi:hypothetical protein
MASRCVPRATGVETSPFFDDGSHGAPHDGRNDANQQDDERAAIHDDAFPAS